LPGAHLRAAYVDDRLEDLVEGGRVPGAGAHRLGEQLAQALVLVVEEVADGEVVHEVVDVVAEPFGHLEARDGPAQCLGHLDNEDYLEAGSARFGLLVIVIELLVGV